MMVNTASENEPLKFELTVFHAEKLLKSGITYKDSLFFPVHRRGRLKYIEADLHDSGINDFFILYAFGNDSSVTDQSQLEDPGNAAEDTVSDKYLAAVYSPVSGNLKLKKILPLKHRSMLQNFSETELSEDSSRKAVILSFSGEDGISDNLITASGKNSFSVFSMNSTLSEFSRIEDINNDGIKDILIYENIFEEGLGYETFITLYSLTDSGFTSDGSLSVVRNLRVFLEKAEKTLEDKNIDAFLRFSLSPLKFSELKGRNLSSKTIIRKIFYPVKKENELFPDINMFLKNGNRIDFVFPEIVENPFRFDRRNIYNFTTYVKVSSESREEAIYIVKIYMNSNPFRQPLFSFDVN